MADRSLADMLPFGKAPALILLITVVAGLFLAFNPVSENKATMQLWTFARNHSVPYQKATPSFAPATQANQLVSSNSPSAGAGSRRISSAA